MQPTISRQTVMIDRRQPILRWSAVFAGAACSAGFWMLLQLLGLGIGLAAIDVSNVGSLRGVGVGTTLWSLIAPLLAMFFGGLVTGRLAQTYERKLAGVHGLVMWALTAIVGLAAMVWIVAMIAAGAARTGGVSIDAVGGMRAGAGDRGEPAQMLGAIGIDADQLLGTINQRLAAQGKPTITAQQLEASVRGVARSGTARGDFDQELLVDQLVTYTRLPRAEAVEVEREVERYVGALPGGSGGRRPHELERRVERVVLGGADAAGKALATLGLSLLLSLIASVVGAMLALGRSRQTGGGQPQGVRAAEPGRTTPPTEPTTTTSPPPPTPTTGPATPIIPPIDVRS